MMNDIENIKFKSMCDKCFKQLGKSEQEYGFIAVDDLGEERLFKGHKDCVIEISETLVHLYRKQEENETIEES